MTASEVVSLIRDIALIAGGVTVTIVSVVLLRKTNRLLKRLEAYLDKVDAVGRGVVKVAQAATDMVPVVKKGATIFGMVFGRFRRKKQPS